MDNYSPYQYAISLGFPEETAVMLDKVNANATNIRRVAKAIGLMSDTKIAKDVIPSPSPSLETRGGGAKMSGGGVVVRPPSRPTKSKKG